ncbi:hypothetical protein FRC10_003728 [Ceratobasidium sp. 414]|nr:hypothetical protein FRC10_003728 [Ceratobasidium sp. 414]
MEPAHTPSRNDIFSTSWQSSDSLVPAPPAPSDLVRRRTTGPALRRPRKSPPLADELAPGINLGDTPPHAEPIRNVPGLRVQTELADADVAPSSLSSRTSSFFDVSPNTGLFPPQRHPPTSPYSTQSVSTTSLTGTSSSTNPSLAASLPPSPSLSQSLPPIQLRFAPRPELKLGQGRFSQVYLAASRQPTKDWRVCVVKRLEPDEESQALGLREAWFLRQLQTSASTDTSHPGRSFITRLHSVEVEEKEKISPTYSHSRSVSDSSADMLRGVLQGSHRQRYPTPQPSRTLLVLEHYPLTLSSLLNIHPHLLTPSTFPRLATELTQALAYCHTKGILHTDVKTANVLLTSSLSVRLADFGSALHLPSLPSGPPTDAAGLGTLSYSAPEFFRPPPSEFGFPADVFSAGVTLGAALFGREPYARLGSARACRTWVSRGAYWMYEERERTESGSVEVQRTTRRSGSASDEEDGVVVGKEQFEKVLGRECTPTELESLVLSMPQPTAAPINSDHLDLEPYSDGSAATYFPGSDEAGTRARVPEGLLFVLKHMCSPAPEQRPTMADVARQFELIAFS